MSKKEATEHYTAKYGDVSDAMDALARNHFIKFSEKRRKEGSRKHHKLYKITEKGLRYLLETKLVPEIFWKAIMLLCYSSKKPIMQNEFEGYYNRFERDFLGHFSIPGYFFLIHVFDDILERWLQTHEIYSLSLSQKVIECLALHGPLTIEKLIEKTGAKQGDINKVIENHSINENFSLESFLSIDTGKKRLDRKNIYHDFITHLLIIINKLGDREKFKLSLFGVLLAIAFIRHHHKFRADANAKAPALFYQHIDEKEYFDRIAQSHEDKIPLVFGKWEFLKSQLGEIMSYDLFDFLIFKNTNLLTSIWLGGNKEFYDDIYSLTHNATEMLMPVYIYGRDCLKAYEAVKPGLMSNRRMATVYQKIGNIINTLDYVRFTTSLRHLKYSVLSESDRKELCELRDIKKIEYLFGDEVCLLFYLDLNRIMVYSSHPELRQHPILDSEGKLVLPPELEETYRLGSPKRRLMATLTKDNDIKEWFSTWIEGLITYRKATLDKMSEFNKEVNESHKNLHYPDKIEDNMEAKLYTPHMEFDMTKICSDIESVYNY
jgi:DNA-binding PadR family transcriptional regulator